MNYEDEVSRVIRAKFAPDFAVALQNADPISYMSGMSRITVPLRANAEVLLDKQLGAIILRGHMLVGKDGYANGRKALAGEAVFATREIESSRDGAQVATHMFNYLRDDFIRKLVAKELEFLDLK